MKKYLVLLLTMIGVTTFVFAQSNNEQSQLEQSTLGRAKLTELAIERARMHGLIGEPTFIKAEFVKAVDWDITLLDMQTLQNPDRVMFVIGIKGEFPPGPRVFGVPLPGIGYLDVQVEGLTMGLDAHTGHVDVMLGDYVDDPVGAINAEHRALYDYFQQIDMEKMLLENAPPPLTEPIWLPEPVMEASLEVIPPP